MLFPVKALNVSQISLLIGSVTKCIGVPQMETRHLPTCHLVGATRNEDDGLVCHQSEGKHFQHKMSQFTMGGSSRAFPMTHHV